MALRREDAVRAETRKYPNGTMSRTYFFKCSECQAEISSQHNYMKKHSGKCTSCSHKGRFLQPAYAQLLASVKRGIEVHLTYLEFLELAKETKCHYCAKEIKRTLKRGEKGYRGYFLDRKDNSGPYSKENCVPCCWSCNQTKGNRFSYSDFLKMTESFRAKSKSELDLRTSFLRANDLTSDY